MGLMAMEVARPVCDEVDGMGRKLKMAETAMKAAFEVVPMRAQYFPYITKQIVKAARQNAI